MRLRSRRTVVASSVIAGLGVFFASLLIAREATRDESARAQLPATTEVPADATAIPGTTPDTTKPFWNVPFENSEKELPRVDQTVNGIQVGPTVPDTGARDCGSGEATAADFDAVDTSNLAIIPRFLPAGAIEGRREAAICRGNIVTHVIDYEIPAEPGLESRLERGEVRWEDVEHGGKITIFRSLSQGPVYRSSNFASVRWRSATVRGLPAAIADPILPIGLGRSAIVIWDERDGVRTVLVGVNRRIEELMHVAEELR